MSNITIHDKQFKKFIDSEVIEKKVDYIADLINNDYSGKKPVILCVLKGSFMFFSDLIKKLNIDCSVSFIQLKSYEDTSSTGVVKEIVGLNDDIKDITINEVYSSLLPGKLLNSVISGPYSNRSSANNAKEKITKMGFDPRLRTVCKEN